MKNKTAIFILTHGDWGKYLIESTETIIGKIEDIYFFPLYNATSLEIYKADIIDKMQSISGYEFLLLSDLLGGTASNIAGTISLAYNVRAISGLSMKMLIEADELRNEYHCEELVDKILENIKGECCDIKRACEEI